MNSNPKHLIKELTNSVERAKWVEEIVAKYAKYAKCIRVDLEDPLKVEVWIWL